jgi:hypothetical protein
VKSENFCLSFQKQNPAIIGISATCTAFSTAACRNAPRRGLPLRHASLISSGGKTKALNLKTRIHGDPEQIMDAYYIDTFEIDVPPGIYRIVIKENKEFKLPRFQVEQGKVFQLYIPQSRIFSRSICQMGRLRSTTEVYGQSKSSAKRNAKEFQKSSVELVSPQNSDEIAIRFCGKTVTGGEISYTSVRVQFKNMYIVADKLILDPTNRRLYFSNEFGSPFVEIDGKNHPNVTGEVFELSY